MFTQAVTLALAAGALMAHTPPAAASHATYRCGYESSGRVYGFVVSPRHGEAVSIACVLVVDGTAVSRPARASGSNVAVTTEGRAGAGETGYVEVCADWTAGEESGYDCAPATQVHPPQSVRDVHDALFDLVADGGPHHDYLYCGALKAAGAPWLVNTTSAATGVTMDTDDCDVWDSYGRLVDFMPYDD